MSDLSFTLSWAEAHKFSSIGSGLQPGAGSAFCIECDRVVTALILLIGLLAASGSAATCISWIRFLHFLHGPHFKASRLSVSEQWQFQGSEHLLSESALPWLDPRRNSMLKSKADNISIH
ncbi:MAG: hypothetical protein AB2693_29580, partial [Candidatus Thiodiazotropha sp.]